MLRIYSSLTQQFEAFEDLSTDKIRPDMLWLDLLNPSLPTEQMLEQQLGIALPTKEEMQDTEPSSRLYTEDGAVYMTASLLVHADTSEPALSSIAFILHQGRLITIRYTEAKSFTLFQSYAAKHEAVCSTATETLLSLLDAIVDRTAEVLEHTAMDVDGVSSQIFKRRHATQLKNKRASTVALSLEEKLADIAFHQNITGKARDSLVSLNRMTSFLMLNTEISKNHGQREKLKSINRDIMALSDQTTYLSNTIIFLLDACLGLISIQQNTIIKIFSVVAVIFLPPTLIASIYGMNFHGMPELGWRFGYPVAIGLMLAAAVLPYFWFKRKGWL